MSTHLLQGIQIGLVLATLVGPLIVLLIQLSLEEGTISSLSAALGIWVSDTLFILAAHFGLGQLREIRSSLYFEEIVGSVGGLVLLAVGLAMWLRKPPKFAKPGQRRKPRLGLSFLKGFAINTFNPFPVVFWSSVSVGIVYEEGLTGSAVTALYGGIMGTIIFTDAIKVFAARTLRRWLNPQHTRLVQRIGGVLLVLFGIGLWLKVWV